MPANDNCTPNNVCDMPDNVRHHFVTTIEFNITLYDSVCLLMTIVRLIMFVICLIMSDIDDEIELLLVLCRSAFIHR